MSLGSPSSESSALAVRLGKASERVRELRRLTEELAEVDAQLLRARQLAQRWRREVGRTAERLQASSGFSLIRFVRGLFTWREDPRAELARQLRSAQASHDEADAKIPALEDARRAVLARQAELADAEVDYADLIEQKEAWLREHREGLVATLSESAACLRALQTEVAVLDKTVSHGRQAEGELILVKEDLLAARAVGGVQMMGGGFIAAAVDHRALDRARSRADKAVRHVREMSVEIGQHTHALHKIEASIGLKVADAMLGSLGVDLFVQRRVIEADAAVSDVLDRVRQAVWAAQKQRKAAIVQLQKASDERARWIEQAG